MVATEVLARFWDGPAVPGRAIELSVSGALIFLPWTGSFTETDAMLAYAESCSLKLGDELSVPCTVRWVSGGSAGLEFGVEFETVDLVDVPALMSAVTAAAPGSRMSAEQRDEPSQRRYFRVPQEVPARLRLIEGPGQSGRRGDDADEWRAVTIVDMSAGGCRVRGRRRLRPGQNVEIELGSRTGIAIAATVRWSKRIAFASMAGLEFTEKEARIALDTAPPRRESPHVGPVSAAASGASVADAVPAPEAAIPHPFEPPRADTVTPRLLAQALESVSEGSLITDGERRTIYANSAFTTITGYDPAEIIGQNCRFLQGSDTSPETVQRMREALSAGAVFQGEILNYRKDGERFWNNLTITPIVDDAGLVSHFVSVQRDVTVEVEERHRLSYDANHDFLTGLPNRAGLRRHLADSLIAATEHDRAVAVIMLDLDRFKPVNDQYGHAVGDRVLVEFAARVSSILRHEDLVARLGGDEFVIALDDLDRADALERVVGVMTRLRAVIEQPVSLPDGSVRIGVSAGIAIFPDHGLVATELLRVSDEALYRAKRRATGSAWWAVAGEPEKGSMSGDAAIAVVAEAEAMSGATRLLELGTVEMLYQPIVDLDSGRTRTVEALARLRTTDGHFMMPDQFLPFCSDSDLVELFEAGLDAALRDREGWAQQGVELGVSLNTPPGLLSAEGIVPTVIAALERHGVPASTFGLEVLETGALDLAASDKNLTELARLGVRIHLDDVSSGFSTLKRMADVPFDTIKIDRRIFEAVDARPLQVIAIIAAIIELAREFGSEVVIEGVEDIARLEVALMLSARSAQGYLFTRPMPPSDVPAWVWEPHAQLDPARLTTPLGALTFHWSVTRPGAPPLPDLADCPITEFVDGIGGHLSRLHGEFHRGGGGRTPSGLALGAALVALVRDNAADQ